MVPVSRTSMRCWRSKLSFRFKGRLGRGKLSFPRGVLGWAKFPFLKGEGWDGANSPFLQGKVGMGQTLLPLQGKVWMGQTLLPPQGKVWMGQTLLPLQGEGWDGDGVHRSCNASQIDSFTASMSRNTSLFQNRNTLKPASFRLFVRTASCSRSSECCPPSTSTASIASRHTKSMT